MSYKYLPEHFSLQDACKSLRADVSAICEIMARGEGDIAFEDLLLSIMNTLRDLERNG
jgi:hypothetical protein